MCPPPSDSQGQISSLEPQRGCLGRSGQPVPASPTHAGSNKGFGTKEAWTQTQVPLLTLCELGPGPLPCCASPQGGIKCENGVWKHVAARRC